MTSQITSCFTNHILHSLAQNSLLGYVPCVSSHRLRHKIVNASTYYQGPSPTAEFHQKLISSLFWRSEVQNRGVGRTTLPLKGPEEGLSCSSSICGSWLFVGLDRPIPVLPLPSCGLLPSSLCLHLFLKGNCSLDVGYAMLSYSVMSSSLQPHGL